MYKKTCLFCAILMAVACGRMLAFAQQPVTDITSQLVAFERQTMDGWLKGDSEPMLSRMDSQITYIHEIDGKRLEGIAAVRQMCEPYRGRPLFDSYEIVGPKARKSGDVVVLSYQLVTHNGDTVGRWNMTQVYEQNG